MTSAVLYKVTALILFALAMSAAISRPLPLQRLIALNVMGAAVFLFLVSVAYRTEGPFPDPVPHAMALTGIVVAVALTAFAVALVRRMASLDAADAQRDDEPR